jgi:hypothetical protein
VEPFKITCVTCRARLAVRNEALIGQILACPKCGSMVQVAPPVAGSVSDSAISGIALGAAVVAPAIAPPPPVTFDDVAEAASDAPSASPPPSPPCVPRPPAPLAPTEAGWSTTKLVAFAIVSAVAGSALVAAAISLLRSTPDAPLPAVADASQPVAALTDTKVDERVDPASLVNRKRRPSSKRLRFRRPMTAICRARDRRDGCQRPRGEFDAAARACSAGV